MASEPADARVDLLQFDRVTAPAEAATSASSAPSVVCGACRQIVVDEYYQLNGTPVCESCRVNLEAQTATPQSWFIVLKASAFGAAAAILGAIIYYAVIALTDFEIGIVAILIGYMVGYAIRKGAAARGGRRFQIVAVLLTYWAVGLAYTPIVIKAAVDADKKNTSTAATAGSATASPAATPVTTQASTTDRDKQPLSVWKVLGILLGFTFALPVIMVFGSLPSGLISAFIIGLGLQRAWQMTAKATLDVSGPFRIGSQPASPAVR